jgi:hypothetical protein
MSVATTSSATPEGRLVSERLNRECFCITLDVGVLCEALTREVGDPEFCDTLIRTHPHLFSRTPVFVPQDEMARMRRIVRAIEAAAQLPDYQAAALSWAPEIAQRDYGPRGVLMGYDFHLAADGPKLIEVNTNAGGAFLNSILAQAQRACCPETLVPSHSPDSDAFERAVVRMFHSEWVLQKRAGVPQRVAIVDDQPQAQYLYPEFVLAQRILLRHGVDSVIADAIELQYENGRLECGGTPVDLVYNRLVDFSFDDPKHAALRAAYSDGAVVVTPNPHIHALFADKRNLALLCDTAKLRSWGLPADWLGDLASIPHTFLVAEQNAGDLWARRRKLFFKPARGYGSKAVYRGDKVTKAVWAEIVRGGYVAQEFAAPSERVIAIDGTKESRKADFRLYVYDGEVLLAAARLYQGQTTNFRTPGGGFAPVFVV